VNVNSLRFKLIWIHSVAIALVVVCIGLVRYQSSSYRSHRSFDSTLLADARLFVSRIQLKETGFELPLDGLNSRDALAVQEIEHYFIVTDPQGNILKEEFHNSYIRKMLRSGDLSNVLRQPSGFGKTKTTDGSEYRFVNFPIPPGIFPVPAIIHIGRSLEPLKGVLNEYELFYFYSVPLILAISVAVGWYLARKALEPFEEITRTAERITYENLNTQLQTQHGEEEIQRLVHSFNGMVRRLNESFQQMRKFNADAAHELRTPLAILQGETEVALRSPNLPEEIRSVLASNLEELDRLKRIVNDMLTLAEAEAGRQVLRKEPVEMKPLLEDLVDQMRLLATDRNVQIDLKCTPELWINADKLWIRRAIINLLDNAIKYSKDGGRVEISAAREDSSVQLKIKDYGIGISHDDIPHIFDRLYRADPARSRNSGGAGLGLALVKWIVEAHKGIIDVESQAEQGACFRITLPARPRESVLH
jgi:heavy metal sensor kinase